MAINLLFTTSSLPQRHETIPYPITVLDKASKKKRDRPRGNIGVSQSSSNVEEKKPAFPPAKRGSVRPGNESEAKRAPGSLILLKDAALHT